MGIVVPFQGHMASRKPKTRRSTSLPRAASSSANTGKYSAGIEPRAFQLETAAAPTPNSTATAPVPPTALIASSTVEIMHPNISRSVKKSSLHEMAVEMSQNGDFHCSMQVDSKEAVGRRLELTRLALKQTDGQMADAAGVSASRWTNYKTGLRKLPVERAADLATAFRLTLEWIYCGEPWGIPGDFLRAYKRLTREAA